MKILAIIKQFLRARCPMSTDATAIIPYRSAGELPNAATPLHAGGHQPSVGLASAADFRHADRGMFC
jgi:hypothetical protein